MTSSNCLLDVAPNIWCIITIKKDNRLIRDYLRGGCHNSWTTDLLSTWHHVFSVEWWLDLVVTDRVELALLHYLVEVVLVRLAPNNVNYLMEWRLRVLLLVLTQILAQYAVIRNLWVGETGCLLVEEILTEFLVSLLQGTILKQLLTLEVIFDGLS